MKKMLSAEINVENYEAILQKLTIDIGTESFRSCDPSIWYSVLNTCNRHYLALIAGLMLYMDDNAIETSQTILIAKFTEDLKVAANHAREQKIKNKL